MATNLGNIAGVVKSINPPLEVDGVTVKKYVIWARPVSGSYALFIWNYQTNSWVGLDPALLIDDDHTMPSNIKTFSKTKMLSYFATVGDLDNFLSLNDTADTLDEDSADKITSALYARRIVLSTIGLVGEDIQNLGVGSSASSYIAFYDMAFLNLPIQGNLDDSSILFLHPSEDDDALILIRENEATQFEANCIYRKIKRLRIVALYNEGTYIDCYIDFDNPENGVIWNLWGVQWRAYVMSDFGDSVNTNTEWATVADNNQVFWHKQIGNVRFSEMLHYPEKNNEIFNYTGSLNVRTDQRATGLSLTTGVKSNMDQRYTNNGTSLDILSWYDDNRAPNVYMIEDNSIKEGLFIRFGKLSAAAIDNLHYQVIIMKAERTENVYSYINKTTLLVAQIDNMRKFSERFIPVSSFLETELKKGEMVFVGIRATTAPSASADVYDLQLILK